MPVVNVEASTRKSGGDTLLFRNLRVRAGKTLVRGPDAQLAQAQSQCLKVRNVADHGLGDRRPRGDCRPAASLVSQPVKESNSASLPISAASTGRNRLSPRPRRVDFLDGYQPRELIQAARPSAVPRRAPTARKLIVGCSLARSQCLEAEYAMRSTRSTIGRK